MIQTDSEFLQYAMHYYDNPGISSLDEFQEDLKKFSYIVSLVNRYKTHKELPERLLLNHIVIVFNVFGLEAKEMLYYKVSKDMWYVLDTYLFFLSKIDKVADRIDFVILEKLKEI